MASHALDVIKILMHIFYKPEHVSSIKDIKQLKNLTLKITMQRSVVSSLDVLLNLNLTNKKKQIDEKAYFDMNELGKTFVVSVIEELKLRLLVGSSFLHKTTCLDPPSLSILGKEVVLLCF